MKVQIIDMKPIDGSDVRMYVATIDGKKVMHQTRYNHLTEDEFRQLAIETYNNSL